MSELRIIPKMNKSAAILLADLERAYVQYPDLRGLDMEAWRVWMRGVTLVISNPTGLDDPSKGCRDASCVIHGGKRWGIDDGVPYLWADPSVKAW